MDLNQKVDNVRLTKQCSIKPDKDSTESKKINLEVDFSGVQLQSVFDKALAATVITWQNGQGRKKFDELSNNQVIRIQFTAPASSQQDPMAALIAKAKAAGVDPNDTDAMTKFIMNQYQNASK